MEGLNFLDRDVYVQKWGHPSSWSGDWSRKGRYLRKDEQPNIHDRLTAHKQYILGMAARMIPSQVIAAIMGVSRESIDRRLRPEGFKNPPGHVGPPRKGTVDFAAQRKELSEMLGTRKIMFGSLCKAVAEEEGITLAEVAAKVPQTPASQFTRWQRGEWTSIESTKLVRIARALTKDVRRQTDLVIAYLVDLTPIEFRPQIDIGQRGEVQNGQNASDPLAGPWSQDVRKKLEKIAAAYGEDPDFDRMVDSLSVWSERVALLKSQKIKPKAKG